MSTLVADEDPLRKALLQRLANDLKAMEWMGDNSGRFDACWPCCWITYDKQTSWGTVEHWLHCICDPTYGALKPGTVGCQHWHHRFEIFLA